MPIIKDEKYLNLSFVPDKLLFRENEISKIRTALVEPLLGGISGTVILYGEPGTGKTTTAKHISRTTADLDCVYMNALSFPSLTALLREVVSTFTRLDQFSSIIRFVDSSIISRIPFPRLSGGGLLMMKWLERVALKAGVDIEKVKRYSVDGRKEITNLAGAYKA